MTNVLDLATLVVAGYSASLVTVLLLDGRTVNGWAAAPLFLLTYLALADLIVRMAS